MGGYALMSLAADDDRAGGDGSDFLPSGARAEKQQ
jgi:hypothetical protein